MATEWKPVPRQPQDDRQAEIDRLVALLDVTPPGPERRNIKQALFPLLYNNGHTTSKETTDDE